jgi:hypothetical protein
MESTDTPGRKREIWAKGLEASPDRSSNHQSEGRHDSPSAVRTDALRPNW